MVLTSRTADRSYDGVSCWMVKIFQTFEKKIAQKNQIFQKIQNFQKKSLIFQKKKLKKDTSTMQLANQILHCVTS